MGVFWKGDRFIGAIVFTWGTNRHLAGEYKLKMTDVLSCAGSL
jgi:hypothetical protein